MGNYMKYILLQLIQTALLNFILQLLLTYFMTIAFVSPS